MNTLAKTLRHSRSHAQSPLVCFAVSLIGLAAFAALTQQGFLFGRLFVLKVLVAFTLGGILMLLLAKKYLILRTFGLANQVTLARGALIALLFGLPGEDLTTGVAWFAAAIALVGLALDGVDGSLARRQGNASTFGARFDMETDALLILIMSVLVWQLGKAGPWILLAGVARYLFTTATYFVAWMRSPLPSSFRRQTVCVLQVLMLLVCLTPLLESPVSDIVALVGLLVLVGSFAIDVAWLAQDRR